MKNEIAFKDKNNAFAVAEIILEEENVIMLSKEESLYILNFEYSQNSDRNDVVFMDRYEFDAHYCEITDEE